MYSEYWTHFYHGYLYGPGSRNPLNKNIVPSSVLAFASTNMDNLYCSTYISGTNDYTLHNCLGQYPETGMLLVTSYLGVRLGSRVDIRYVGLLGFIPINFGVCQLAGLLRYAGPRFEPGTLNNKLKLSQGFWAVASVTLGNGGDNIGTYIPLFSTLDKAGISILLEDESQVSHIVALIPS
jgi:cadmium resistance protein CadD (predicted permease)